MTGEGTFQTGEGTFQHISTLLDLMLKCYCLGKCYISEGHKMCHMFPLPEMSKAECPENFGNLEEKMRRAEAKISQWCLRGDNEEVCRGMRRLKDWFEGLYDRLD